MKTKTNPHPSVVLPRRYPSLSDNFGLESAPPKKRSAIFESSPRLDASFRLLYLRLIAAVATAMAITALVANA